MSRSMAPSIIATAFRRGDYPPVQSVRCGDGVSAIVWAWSRPGPSSRGGLPGRRRRALTEMVAVSGPAGVVLAGTASL